MYNEASEQYYREVTALESFSNLSKFLIGNTSDYAMEKFTDNNRFAEGARSTGEFVYNSIRSMIAKIREFFSYLLDYFGGPKVRYINNKVVDKVTEFANNASNQVASVLKNSNSNPQGAVNSLNSLNETINDQISKMKEDVKKIVTDDRKNRNLEDTEQFIRANKEETAHQVNSICAKLDNSLKVVEKIIQSEKAKGQEGNPYLQKTANKSVALINKIIKSVHAGIDMGSVKAKASDEEKAGWKIGAKTEHRQNVADLNTTHDAVKDAYKAGVAERKAYRSGMRDYTKSQKETRKSQYSDIFSPT